MRRIQRLERRVLRLEPIRSALPVNVLTVASSAASSSPASATTTSPLLALAWRWTTTKSPGMIPASIMLSPLTRRRNSSFPRRQGLGHGDVVLDVLLGEKRAARSDLAHERKYSDLPRLARCRASSPTSSSALGLVGSRLDVPGLLELGEVDVDGRRRREPDLGADLAHRRRVPVLCARTRRRSRRSLAVAC